MKRPEYHANSYKLPTVKEKEETNELYTAYRYLLAVCKRNECKNCPLRYAETKCYTMDIGRITIERI